MSQKIVPTIWCNRSAEEAAEFYAAAFPGADSAVEARYPEEGLPDFQRDFAGLALTASVSIPDPAGANPTRLVLLNAGDEFRPNSSISFMLNLDPLFFGAAPDGDAEAARAALDRLWRVLSDGGRVLMPLDAYPHSPHYGWVEDRYGVSWQLMLTDAAGDPRPFVVPSFMFAGPAQNRAGEALDVYVEVFDDAEAGARHLYEAQVGPAVPGSILFADFRVGDQWFAVMDSAVAQEVTFGNGLSFQVGCRDQAEIDRLWEVLSSVAEAERCGWCVDRFGVSWQILPENMGELMQRPGAHEHLMAMGKIVIDEF